MQRTIANALRGLWVALMAILLVLVVTNAIGGFTMALYGAVVLAVAITEMALRHRLAK